MAEISITTFEDIHHVCLMYGLQQAYRRFPFLASNILMTPPPFRRNPKRPHIFIGRKTNPICVQYHKKDILVIYDEERVTVKVATEFAKAIMEEYLRLRHPYMKHVWNERILVESTTQHQIAEVILSNDCL